MVSKIDISKYSPEHFQFEIGGPFDHYACDNWALKISRSFSNENSMSHKWKSENCPGVWLLAAWILCKHVFLSLIGFKRFAQLWWNYLLPTPDENSHGHDSLIFFYSCFESYITLFGNFKIILICGLIKNVYNYRAKYLSCGAVGHKEPMPPMNQIRGGGHMPLMKSKIVCFCPWWKKLTLGA